jgi:hypothetical protein
MLDVIYGAFVLGGVMVMTAIVTDVLQKPAWFQPYYRVILVTGCILTGLSYFGYAAMRWHEGHYGLMVGDILIGCAWLAGSRFFATHQRKERSKI